MDEYADIYYVDENRNATVRDHRHQSQPTGLPGFLRPRQPTRTVYVDRPTVRHEVAPIAPVAPMIYPQQQFIAAQPQLMYPQGFPPGFPQQSTAAALFGKLTTGQIVDMVAQAFAALQSLPAAPVATRETSTDVANLILFQNALAHHAKRDEQVRTLGSLVAKLVG